MENDDLILGGRRFGSRLLIGTGKYRDLAQTRAAALASGAQIVTVAVRRANIGQDADAPNLLEALPPSEFTILPNTAGCYDAESAVRTLRLARELLDGENLAKLEVLGEDAALFPNMRETLKAAETLARDGFCVLAYASDDPVAARQLEEAGCAAVMPLASLIGSGLGIVNPHNLELILARAKVPVLVDAGVGAPSHAARAMEMGCAGVLTNTAIAAAQDPVQMAAAMKAAVAAGRRGFLAGLMESGGYRARASSPSEGVLPPQENAKPKK